jgi:hypothetical protein
MYTKGYTTKGIQMNSCILTVYGQNLHIPPITNIITFIMWSLEGSGNVLLTLNFIDAHFPRCYLLSPSITHQPFSYVFLLF